MPWPASSATARPRSTPTSPSPRRPASAAAAGTRRWPRPICGGTICKASRRDSSKSPRRWASRRRWAIAARRSSRRSGLSAELVDRHFTGTPARLSGIGLPEIESDILRRHTEAYTDPAPKLADPGFVRYRKDGEPHAFEPPLVKLLQEAVNTGSAEAYRAYREHVAQHAPTAVRDLMRVRPLGDPIPLDEVEPVAQIVKRFVVTAMSLGSLSPEAHRTLSIAMNRLGARSNSGEGGEDQTWYDEVRSRHRPLQGEAGRLRPLRRHRPLPVDGRRAGDQDFAGEQAGRGRADPRPQGDALHRQRAPRGARACR